MPRPRKTRVVEAEARATYYKPRGIPLYELSEVVLSLDGLEALRHADVDGLDQTEAAKRMGISRSTFSRLLAEARRVVATALTQGWALRIEGGPVTMSSAGRDAVCDQRGTPRPRQPGPLHPLTPAARRATAETSSGGDPPVHSGSPPMTTETTNPEDRQTTEGTDP